MFIITVRTEGFVRVPNKKPCKLLGFFEWDPNVCCIFAYKTSAGLLGYNFGNAPDPAQRDLNRFESHVRTPYSSSCLGKILIQTGAIAGNTRGDLQQRYKAMPK